MPNGNGATVKTSRDEAALSRSMADITELFTHPDPTVRLTAQNIQEAMALYAEGVFTDIFDSAFPSWSIKNRQFMNMIACLVSTVGRAPKPQVQVW